jgi:hypothetical protein
MSDFEPMPYGALWSEEPADDQQLMRLRTLGHDYACTGTPYHQECAQFAGVGNHVLTAVAAYDDSLGLPVHTSTNLVVANNESVEVMAFTFNPEGKLTDYRGFESVGQIQRSILAAGKFDNNPVLDRIPPYIGKHFGMALKHNVRVTPEDDAAVAGQLQLLTLVPTYTIHTAERHDSSADGYELRATAVTGIDLHVAGAEILPAPPPNLTIQFEHPSSDTRYDIGCGAHGCESGMEPIDHVFEKQRTGLCFVPGVLAQVVIDRLEDYLSL